MLVTVSRQYGAGGSEVARLIAERLGWSFVDNELVDLVARRAGLSSDDVARQEERVPSFVERLVRTLAVSSQDFAVPGIGAGLPREEPQLVRITEAVVKEIAAQGQVVLVGRAAPAVIGQAMEAFHVKVAAARGFRIAQAASSEGLDLAAAEQLMDTTDAQRARYHREYYGRDWDDPSHYHMILNTGLLGFDGAAAAVVEAVGRRQKA
jgi:cytidylate kinase